jgi:hypothetical protein
VTRADEREPVILVSSSVYGIEDLLDQTYAVLKGFGYEVWMSHAGTMPVDPNKSNFQNCLDAVGNCQLFLGLITTWYGSGKSGSEASITHRELLRAIELDKLRWFLAHEHVAFARQLLKQFRFKEDGSPNDGFVFKPTRVLDDLRVIDMYEAAIRHDVRPSERTGNWVQSYFRHQDALEYVSAQFGDMARIRELIAQRSAP